MDKPQIIAHIEKSLNFTLFDSKWIPSSAKFVLLGNHARGTGAMQIYEVAQGDVKLVKDVSMFPFVWEKSNKSYCNHTVPSLSSIN